ncbi:ComF family protein [Altericista sp. CCNU0014]|uniref:ComF family protein n=1 Tax=Altericista sp. CCNU0014 TaxID=3082949 RepID=UPI00384D676B
MDNQRSLWAAWAERLRQRFSFILQGQCALCDRPTSQVFCQDCTRRLQACRVQSSVLQIAGLPPLYSWGYYEGALKQSLARLKYGGRPQVAEPLGQWLAQVWLDSGLLERGLVVVPIPLHGDRQQQRGYNQAELIARSFCEVTGMPLRARGLIRTQPTTAQYGLLRLERYQNLSNVFQVGAALQKSPNLKDIVLVDDIFTTGATLKSATETLQQSGFRVVALFTAALSERQIA